MTAHRWWRDAAAAVGERLGRANPGSIPGVFRVVLVAAWLLTAALAVVALVPGLTAGVEAEQVGATGPVGLFRAPPALRLLVAAAGAVLAAVLVILTGLPGARAGSRGLRALVVAGASGFPALALAADRAWPVALVALALLVVAEFLLLSRLSRSPGGTLLTAGVSAAPWIVLLAAQPGTPRDGAGTWVWTALFGFAAAFAAFGAYYGVASAAASRARPLRPLFRDGVAPWRVLLVVAVVVVIVVLRLTVARELFADPDPALWTPLAEPVLSWLHAAAVATLVVVLAVRAERTPRRRAGEGRVIAGLAVAGNADLVLAVGILLVGLVVAAATGGTLLPDPGPVVVAAAKLAGVAIVVAAVLLPGFRGTAARALGFVAGAYLVPLTLDGLLRALGAGPEPLGGLPASPVQVVLLLVAVALAAAIAGLAGGASRLGSSLVIRLAVVPVVAVHAGLLLPAAWSGLGRIVLVVGVLAALLFLLPPRAATVERRTADLLGASALQLLALATFVLALPAFVEDPAMVVLGLFWLAVVVIAGGVIRTEPAPGPAA